VEDYPRTLAEFDRRFATNEACRAYLVQLRWPDGFQCPKCGHQKAWITRVVLLQCASCGRQTSVTAGTIFQDTRTPLMTWFRAMWWVTSQKTGASAKGLQHILGLGSYETAWTWLHKLRRAMVRPGRDRLTGRVEVDETFLGGLEEGHRGRGTEKKALIAVAVEQVGAGMGRIRMRRIADGSADTLQGFVEEAVTPGSLLHTDGWISYDRLEKHGYRHRITFVKGRKGSAADPLPRVHRVVSLLKRWLLGTHQGAVTIAHLDYYLDEFTFRFNRRTSRHRGKLFYRLVQQAVAVDPAPYRSIVKNVRVGRPARRRRSTTTNSGRRRRT
jgi:transposase-like protein